MARTVNKKHSAFAIKATPVNSRNFFFCAAFTAVAFATLPSADAGTREQVKRIYDRIAGVPPTETVLDAMVAEIDTAGATDAAFTAAALKIMDPSDSYGSPDFYNVTLKNLVTPWTNRDFDVFAPLNDYTATFVGMVRDNRDIRDALSDDILYVGNTGHPSLSSPPAYQNDSNAHYIALENQGADLSDSNVLQATTQSSVIGLPVSATAGIMTTRAAAQAFFIDGTNRAMFRYTLLNHMCYDLEQLKDTTRNADRIRQDISRSPGGDSRIFLNNCVGCHSGMDAMAQAFAYYDFVNTDGDDIGDDGFIEYSVNGDVNPKYHINSSTFEFGYVTPDDRWDNNWRAGPNAAVLGFSESLPGGGNGAKSLGVELANSEAFAQCQVKKVFQAVCLRAPVSDNESAPDRAAVESMIQNFKSSEYKLKQVFADSAVYCKGS